MAGQIVIRADDSGKVRFNLLDEDGTVLWSSKGFEDAGAAREGLDRARRLVADAEVVDQTDDGSPVRADPDVAEPGR